MQENEIPFALFESELLALLNGAPGVHLDSSRFRRAVRPLMVQRGEARCNRADGNRRATWVYDPDYIWEWVEYLAVRAELIRRGEWSAKRPYSIEDLEDITRLDAYADVLDALFPREQPPAAAEFGDPPA